MSTAEVTHTHTFTPMLIHTALHSPMRTLTKSCLEPIFLLKSPKGKTTEKAEPLNLDLIPANDLIGINSGQDLGVRYGSSPAPQIASGNRSCSSADLALVSF